MKNSHKKELAKSMFIIDGYSVNEICQKLNVSRRTLYNWMQGRNQDENWKKQRESHQQSPQEFIHLIDKQLHKAFTDQDFDPKISDFVIKMVTAREKLKAESSQNVGGWFYSLN